MLKFLLPWFILLFKNASVFSYVPSNMGSCRKTSTKLAKKVTFGSTFLGLSGDRLSVDLESALSVGSVRQIGFERAE